MASIEHRGYTIRRSGRTLWKVLNADNTLSRHGKCCSVEACICVINANEEHRVMTDAEYRTVYPTSPFAPQEVTA